MFASNRIHPPLQRRFYSYALAGMALLSAGYLLRGQVDPGNELPALLLGVFPNLLGSFATPFLLTVLLMQRYPASKAMASWPVFGLTNLFVLAASLLIEYLHVLFQAGAWDANDIAASGLGGLSALAAFGLARGPIRKAHLVGIALLAGLTGSVVYNVYDNQRFVVVKQEIGLERLPRSFDGFRILQISDLHGRFFGQNQADLIGAINDLEYDMIALTGDMSASTAGADTRESAKAILDLLDGIENKEAVFWVDGNSGPYAIESFAGTVSGRLTEIGTVLEEKGCRVLILPAALTRGSERIWITPEMSEILFEARYRGRSIEDLGRGGKDDGERVQAFYEEAYRVFKEINRNGEVKIMLEHTPKQTNLSDQEREPLGELDYDLILAGHYHGGQLRLPLIGAVYIPSPTSGWNQSGFFPDQREVKGLYAYGSVPQYVSAGLGASGHVRPASFRLFNTPEINLITLRRR